MPTKDDDPVKLLLHPPEKTQKAVIEGCSRQVVEEASKRFREEFNVTAETGIMTGTRKVARDEAPLTIYFNIMQHKGKRKIECRKR